MNLYHDRTMWVSKKYWTWFPMIREFQIFHEVIFDNFANNFSKNSLKTPLETISSILNRKHL